MELKGTGKSGTKKAPAGRGRGGRTSSEKKGGRGSGVEQREKDEKWALEWTFYNFGSVITSISNMSPLQRRTLAVRIVGWICRRLLLCGGQYDFYSYGYS